MDKIIEIIAKHYSDMYKELDKKTSCDYRDYQKVTSDAIKHFETVFKGIKVKKDTLDDLRGKFFRVLQDLKPKVDYFYQSYPLDSYMDYLQEIET